MRMIIGHSRINKGGKREYESLRAHSWKVANACAAACAPMGLAYMGCVIGMLHDAGKADSEVQLHICGKSNKKKNHSSAGAWYIWKTYGMDSDPVMRLAAKMIALAIVCHHSGRSDILDIDGNDVFLTRLGVGKQDEAYAECMRRFFVECCSEEMIREWMRRVAEELRKLKERITILAKAAGNRKTTAQFYVGMVQRAVFGALVDADWSRTAEFMNDEKPARKEMLEERQALWNELSKNVESFVGQLAPRHPVDTLRKEISDQCFRAAVNTAGIYRLFVPTGGGKTYSGLRFCVETARQRNAAHIFYFAPYKSILTQNTAEFRKALGGDGYVLEHHSDVVIETNKQNNEDDEDMKKAWLMQTQRWQGVPFISTTMVQWLNTVFAAPRQNVRRMAPLAGSVLFFDEVQSLPIQDVYIFNLTINALAGLLGCTVVLCTATQPELASVAYPVLFSKNKDLVPDYEERFLQFKRTEVVVRTCPGGYTAEGLAELTHEVLRENDSVLLILNTKKAAEKVYDQIAAAEPEARVYYLSTNLCMKHRREVIGDILRRQKHPVPGEKVVCVSTQLIEAGVDVSFDCVVRSMAGLNSVAQAAGRCNRHGESACRNVYLVSCAAELEDLRYLPDIDKARLATERLLECLPEGTDLLAPETMDAYYRIYFTDTTAMKYPVKAPGGCGQDLNLLDLLSNNSYGVAAAAEAGTPVSNKTPWDMHQAFGMAESHFKAIPSETVPILVSYEEGENLVLELTSAETRQVTAAFLRKCQPYTVAVNEGQKRALAAAGALDSLLDGTILVLKKEFYHTVKGVVMEPLAMEFLSY